jgi:hypothetical protein
MSLLRQMHTSTLLIKSQYLNFALKTQKPPPERGRLFKNQERAFSTPDGRCNRHCLLSEREPPSDELHSL